jgi:hypothetical protein
MTPLSSPISLLLLPFCFVLVNLLSFVVYLCVFICISYSYWCYLQFLLFTVVIVIVSFSRACVVCCYRGNGHCRFFVRVCCPLSKEIPLYRGIPL